MITFIIICSLFCVGLHLSAEEGYILNFIRSPFDWMMENHVREKNNALLMNEPMPGELWSRMINVIGKPLITCVRCMGSLWTLVIYYFLQPDLSLIQVIICIPAVSFLNSFIFDVYKHT